MGRSSCLAALGLVFLVASGAVAYAQGETGEEVDPCAARDLPTDVRPDADGPPTQVSVGVRMVDLLSINDVQQTLTGDFAVSLSWTDPRLAHLQGCEMSLDDVWTPGLVIMNSGRTFLSRPREVDLGPNGRATYIQRYYGTLASYHQLRDFPFDIQEIAFSLVPAEWGEDQVQLVANQEFTGRRDLLNISDWTIENVRGEIHSYYMDATDRRHSRYNFIITASRIHTFYLWKIFLPVCLIVAMSWCVFWLSPAQSGPHIGLSATSMLTLIAFIFATSNMVPALGYFTLLDFFIGGATILVFLALVQSVMTSYLASQQEVKMAVRINKACRFVFPGAFAAILASMAIRAM